MNKLHVLIECPLRLNYLTKRDVIPVNRPKVPPMVPNWSLNETLFSLLDLMVLLVGLSTVTKEM